jgi:hypothetical protein
MSEEFSGDAVTRQWCISQDVELLFRIRVLVLLVSVRMYTTGKRTRMTSIAPLARGKPRQKHLERQMRGSVPVLFNENHLGIHPLSHIFKNHLLLSSAPNSC